MWVFYLISLPLTTGMVLLTLRYFAGPHVPRYVLFTVGYTWFCSLSIIILVPADIWAVRFPTLCLLIIPNIRFLYCKFRSLCYNLCWQGLNIADFQEFFAQLYAVICFAFTVASEGCWSYKWTVEAMLSWMCDCCRLQREKPNKVHKYGQLFFLFFFPACYHLS